MNNSHFPVENASISLYPLTKLKEMCFWRRLHYYCVFECVQYKVEKNNGNDITLSVLTFILCVHAWHLAVSMNCVLANSVSINVCRDVNVEII